jgi:hypothetical protein
MRCLVCGCGTVQVRVPRLEQPYESQIVPRYERMTPEMKNPKAVKCLQEACDQLFTYFRFPCLHWKSLKTTNPIESLFSAVKLRTKAARRLRTRLSAVCLVFQVLKHSERRILRINGYTIVARTIDIMKSKAPKLRMAA